ncbi:MAG: hypothetical protein NTV34_09530, partial [Proteobacteria bacterium]|nr:hypothetical protein [Pseudomonadota bacterium]
MICITKNSLVVLSVGVAASLMVACGRKTARENDKATVSASTLATDPVLSASAVNAQYSDLMSGISDQSSGGAALAEEGELAGVTDKTTVTRSCVESDSSAMVTLEGSIDKTVSKTSANGKVRIETVIKGESTQKRTWSRTDGSAVVCNGAKEFANVKWESPSGLSLAMSFSRQRDRTSKIVGPRVTRDASSTFKTSGTRYVTWSSNATTEDSSTTYIRNKSIVSEVTREESVKDKNGTVKDLKLIIETKDGAPLAVQVERLKTDHSIVARTITSGTLISKKDESDGAIEMVFSNLKVSLTTGECKLVSGS